MTSVEPYDAYAGSIYLTATTLVPGISWGIMTCLYSVCMYSLVCDLRSTRATKMTTLLSVWITLLWISSSLSTMATAYGTIYAYSWQTDYPGGPSAWLSDAWASPAAELAYSTYNITMWLADAMMVWRVTLFCQGVRHFIRGLVLSFIWLVYIGAVGTACFTLVILGLNQTLDLVIAMKTAIPALTLSMALNIFSTAFISIRLFLFKRWTEKTLGHEAQASPYTNIAAMLIESSTLYAVWSIALIIVYATNNPGQFVLLFTLCHVQVIASILIVYRVSRGIGWERTTSANLVATHLSFAVAETNPDTTSN